MAKYIPRSCNTWDHYLAKITIGKIDSFVWKGNFPQEIKNVFSFMI